MLTPMWGPWGLLPVGSSQGDGRRGAGVSLLVERGAPWSGGDVCPLRSAEKIPLAGLARGSSEAQGGPGPARARGLRGQRALVHVTSRLRQMRRFAPCRGNPLSLGVSDGTAVSFFFFVWCKSPVQERRKVERAEQEELAWCRLSHLCRNCTRLKFAGTRNSGRRSLDKGLFYTSSTRFLLTNQPIDRPTRFILFV